MASLDAFLQARRLWSQFESEADVDLARLFLRVHRLYGRSDRAYHGRRHVLDVVRTSYRLARSLPIRERIAVVAAAWYHDVVYDSTRHDNEERSADMLAAELRGAGMDAKVIDKARRLILETKRHRPRKLDRAAGALVDSDLAILSAPVDRYDTYAAAIRREYAWVPEAAYVNGRSKALEGFLKRLHIYGSRLMRHRETAARSNLLREIAALRRSDR